MKITNNWPLGQYSLPAAWLCHACSDVREQMELTTCDGVTDWKLVCPGACNAHSLLHSSIHLFVARPDRDRIAVWGHHAPIWTFEGRVAPDYMVTYHVLGVLSYILHGEKVAVWFDGNVVGLINKVYTTSSGGSYRYLDGWSLAVFNQATRDNSAQFIL